MGDICDVLNVSESLSNEDIGRRIIEIIENTPVWSEDPDWIWDTMSAMTTSGVTLAVQQLDLIAEYMSVHAALLIDNLEASRERTWRLAEGINYDTKSVDIYDFALQLSKDVSDPFLLQALDDLRDLLDEAIIADCHRAPSTICHPHGLSVHFPQSKDGYTETYRTDLDMTAHTSWDEFLLEFYHYQQAPHGYIAGLVVADCPTLASPIEGVTVTVCQASSGDLLGAAVTQFDGSYRIEDLVAENYIVKALPPLGYAMESGEINVTLPGGAVPGVDIALLCTGESNNPHSTAYWKRAIREALGGGGKALLDAAEICSCLDAIGAHFVPRGITLYTVPSGSSCQEKLAVVADLLHPLPPVKTGGNARSHLMALLLNVAAGNMRTDDVISKDGATVSQAITHCNDLLGTRDVKALVIANLINNGVVIPAGWIPLSTSHIVFTPPKLPDAGVGTAVQSEVEDALVGTTLQVSVSPNPFNPSTTISFNVPNASHVTVSIFDITGRRVKTLLDRTTEIGVKQIVWNGRDEHGFQVGSGIYFYRVTMGSDVDTGKLLLLK